jgi:signal transduction histidine kinase
VRDTGSLRDGRVAGHPGGGLIGWPVFHVRPLYLDRWRPQGGWIDIAWVVLWVLGLAGIVIFERWEAVPFQLIWIAFALLYCFRVRSTEPALWVLASMIVTTFAAIGLDVLRGAHTAAQLTELPLMAVILLMLMWHGHRRLVAAERTGVSEESARLLTTQRRFLQDVSHQLRTPITIALGHSELLARHLTDKQDKRDINVIVGELNRLRRLSERLLLIAASANPDSLRPAPVELDQFIADEWWRWRPTAERRWQLGQLDQAAVLADRERLGLAIDALLENATQHTGPGDIIRLSVVRDDLSGYASLVVEDTGDGIAPSDLGHIFDRFATGSDRAGHHGTGLGLALVRAVAEGHGGQVRAQSTPGLGSRFDLLLPISAAITVGPPAPPAAITEIPPASPVAITEIPPASPVASTEIPPASPVASTEIPPASPVAITEIPPATPCRSSP